MNSELSSDFLWDRKAGNEEGRGSSCRGHCGCGDNVRLHGAREGKAVLSSNPGGSFDISNFCKDMKGTIAEAWLLGGMRYSLVGSVVNCSSLNEFVLKEGVVCIEPLRARTEYKRTVRTLTIERKVWEKSNRALESRA